MKKVRKNRWICGLLTAMLTASSLTFSFAPCVYASPIIEIEIAPLTDEENKEKIETILFIGDYVTAGMKEVSGGDEEAEKWQIGEDKGLTWFKSEVENLNVSSNCAIVINLGFNEVSNTSKADDYVSFFNSKAEEWNEEGAQVYYSLVLPVDESKYGSKINDKINLWNDTMKNGLSKDIIIIDSISATKDRFSTKNDGYHYSKNVYKSLYDYTLHTIGVLTPEEKAELESENSKPKESITTNGWGFDKKGFRVYYDEKKNIVVGWREIEGGNYYFDSEGHYVTGLQTIDGKTYYFNSIGLMRTGLCKIDDDGHYAIFAETGERLEGWQDYKGERYYISSDGWCLVGWWTIGTRAFYFKSDGAVARGVTMIGDDVYYFTDDGAVIVGWQEIDGQRYYFQDGGKMATGKTIIDNTTYFFDKDGTCITGWNAENDGMRYYNGDGSMATGMTEIKGKKYYFSQGGLMQLGWFNFENGRRYFGDTGAMTIGEAVIDDEIYYFDDDGYMQTGIVRYPDGTSRFFNDDGKMKTGWQKLGGKKYYITAEGNIATGCHKIDGKLCFFDDDGAVKFTIPLTFIWLLILILIIGVPVVYIKKNPENFVNLLEKFNQKLGESGASNNTDPEENKESEKKKEEVYDDDDEVIIDED